MLHASTSKIIDNLLQLQECGKFYCKSVTTTTDITSDIVSRVGLDKVINAR